MKTRKGKNRLVLIFPSLGLAIKFPLVHISRAVHQLFSYGFHRPYGGDIRIDVNKSLLEHLFKGIGDNWREYTFYLKTRHPFCQPTYFSLFGLFNLQRATEPCGRSMQALFSEFHAVTDGEAFQDAHHFSNPSNFCHKGKLFLILDYGHLKTQEIILKHGDKLSRCQHGLCLGR